MISICIPTYNRTDLLFESYSKVIDDDRISEIVIVDDCSTDEVWVKMCDTIGNHPKIKLFRNEKNLDCYRNKREAVSKASNEWVILLDSDNQIDKEYLYAVVDHINKGFDCILQPSWAKPYFDFRQFEGLTFDHSNVKHYVNNTTFTTMLNAMNYAVKRDDYLAVWDGSVDPVTSDSIWQNYCWLKSGREIYVVPGMHYTHLVHKGSHYQNNVKRTPKGFHESIVNKLKAMR